jgi:hypothetical protein
MHTSTPSQSAEPMKREWPLFLALALLMAATRSHHFASVTHLPDASWAVFFLAGFYLRAGWSFAALLSLAGASDFLAIHFFAVSDFCVSPAYVFLLPAYGSLWLAGRWYAGRYRFNFAGLAWLALGAVGGALAAELLSGGGFYFFSGRFAETSLAVFASRLLQYFPQSLEGMGLYVGTAAIAHIALTLALRSGRPERAHGVH